MVWTGRLHFTAVDRPGHPRELVELMLRLDRVEILLDGRSAGLVDRDALRLWMARPRDPLNFDDVRMSLSPGGLVLMIVIGERHIPLPAAIEAHLREIT